MHRDNIGISLNKYCIVLLLYRLLGKEETVYLATFVVYLTLWRVLILRHLLVGAQRATTKAHHAARDIVDGKHHTVIKPVAQCTIRLSLNG